MFERGLKGAVVATIIRKLPYWSCKLNLCSNQNIGSFKLPWHWTICAPPCVHPIGHCFQNFHQVWFLYDKVFVPCTEICMCVSLLLLPNFVLINPFSKDFKRHIQSSFTIRIAKNIHLYPKTFHCGLLANYCIQDNKPFLTFFFRRSNFHFLKHCSSTTCANNEKFPIKPSMWLYIGFFPWKHPYSE